MMDDTDHQRLDRIRADAEGEESERIAARFRERYSRDRMRAMGGDGAILPRSALMPGVDDAQIWGLKCKVRSLSLWKGSEGSSTEFLCFGSLVEKPSSYDLS